MAAGRRDHFIRERTKAGNINDEEAATALDAFADALDPEHHHDQVPKLRQNGTIEHDNMSNTTAGNYLRSLRLAFERGLDLLEVDCATINNFMNDLATEPEERRYDLVEYDGTLTKPSCKQWQSAARAFYRFCSEPGVSDDRPVVNVEWPADDIIMFTEQSDPKHDEEDMPEQSDLEALREAIVDHSMNTRRDLAFLQLAAGTGQRVYALITLRVKHVNPYPEDGIPHILLNPEIKGDGDKGTIENTGRWKPIVTNPGPIEKWIQNHPLRDEGIRKEHDAPEDFRDCYLFIGDIGTSNTNAAEHWHKSSQLSTLKRRKANTADMPNVKTVDIPVNPHNWRHYAYTKSQELPIDESTRRKVFGWAPGSTTGQTVYGHKQNEQAGREFAEEWARAFDSEEPGETEGIAEQVAGTVFGGDLPPDTRKALARDLVNDDEFMAKITKAVKNSSP